MKGSPAPIPLVLPKGRRFSRKQIQTMRRRYWQGKAALAEPITLLELGELNGGVSPQTVAGIVAHRIYKDIPATPEEIAAQAKIKRARKRQEQAARRALLLDPPAA